MVYVDDFHKSGIRPNKEASFTRRDNTKFKGINRDQKCAHMIADTHEELEKMARAIGLAANWIISGKSWKEHYIIPPEARQRAIKLGAIEISFKELTDKMEAKRT